MPILFRCIPRWKQPPYSEHLPCRARSLRDVHRPGMQDRKLGDAAVPFGGKAGHARDLHASGDLTFEITDSLHKSIDHMAMQVRVRLVSSRPRSSHAVGCPGMAFAADVRGVSYTHTEERAGCGM